MEKPGSPVWAFVLVSFIVGLGFRDAPTWWQVLAAVLMLTLVWGTRRMRVSPTRS